MGNFFSKIYKYRESEQRHKKENFLTEILAFTLEKDEIFRARFLKEIDCHENIANIDIYTQLRDDEAGVPDMVIKVNDDILIVVEVKVGAMEGYEQLKRYSEYLLRDIRPKKYLVYLTRNTGKPVLTVEGFKYFHLQWYSIFRMLESSGELLTKEFKEYLIIERMSKKVDLRENQKSVILDYLNFMSSVRDFLDDLRERVEMMGVSDVSLNEKLKEGEIGIAFSYYNVPIWVGFYQYETQDQIMIGISCDSIETKREKFKEIAEGFKSMSWESYFLDEKKKNKKTFYINRKYSNYLIDGQFKEKIALADLEEDIAKMKDMIDAVFNVC